MKTTKLTCTLLFMSLSSFAKADTPQLDQYQLLKSEIYEARPAPVDLASYPHAENYRTVLTQKAKDGPNFAGHYTIVSIGCGDQCQDNWLIDARDGKIHDRFPSQLGVQYQLDSSMVIVNPANSQEALSLAVGHSSDDINTKIQVWKDGRFDVLKEMNWKEASKEAKKSLELK